MTYSDKEDVVSEISWPYMEGEIRIVGYENFPESFTNHGGTNFPCKAEAFHGLWENFGKRCKHDRDFERFNVTFLVGFMSW